MHRFVNVSGICKGNRAVLLFNFHLKEIPPSSSLSVMQSSRLKKKKLDKSPWGQESYHSENYVTGWGSDKVI